MLETGFSHGDKDVAVAGTAEALGAAVDRATSLLIQAKSTNTNNIYLGDSSVSSTNFGIKLAAGESFPVGSDKGKRGFSQLMNLSKLFLDVDTNGEGVTFLSLVNAPNNAFES